jgi:hypothetical protein
MMILDGIPFRIVLWNNNNWDTNLPDKIMEAFPVQIVLDIKEMALQNSYTDEATGEIVLSTAFEGSEYQKILNYDEIIAVLDLNGQPYILNNFQQDQKITLEDVINDNFLPRTKNDVIEMVMSDGVPVEAAQRSINAFIKFNPDIAERLGE